VLARFFWRALKNSGEPMQPHNTESSCDYEQHQDGGIFFFLRSETIEISVKVHKTALDQLGLTVTDPKAKAQLFNTHRAAFEAFAYEKYRATQSSPVEISVDDLLFAGRLLNGMCVV
jgi:hypothetical protein